MKRILVVSLAAMFLGLNGLVWADEAMMAATPNAMAPASTPGAMMMKKKMKKMKKKKAMKKDMGGNMEMSKPMDPTPMAK